MIEQLSANIASFFVNKNIAQQEDYEVYHYGIKHIMINIMIFLVISVIATLFQCWEATIAFMTGFMPLRLIAGGYHANSLARCQQLTLIVYISNLVAINYISTYMDMRISVVESVAIIVCIWSSAPVDHRNRVLSENQYIIAKRKSRMWICVMVVLINCGMVFLPSLTDFLCGVMMGLITMSISLIIGKQKREVERNESI